VNKAELDACIAAARRVFGFPVLQARVTPKPPQSVGDQKAMQRICMARLRAERRGNDASIYPARVRARKVSVASAYRDAAGWALFDRAGNLIERWPAGWPERITRAELVRRGVKVAP